MGEFEVIKNINDIKIIEKNKFIRLRRLRDKNGFVIPNKYSFLKNYYGSDILRFKNNFITIIFIKYKTNIINFIIFEKIKKYISTEIDFTDLKKILLNENYKDLNDILLFSKNNLFNYELNLLNDLNDWLNDNISNDKKYYLLHN